MSSGVQTLRFRGPESKPASISTPRHTGILQDQLRRSTRRPWAPSFSRAVQMLLLMRVAGAMYSNIDDCDEVYNFWEPLHFLDRGLGFQTWEVSPNYGIRSWAYILLHMLPVRIASLLFGAEKRPAFFALRMSLALLSTLCEAKLYRSVLEKINERVGRYFFFMLLFSAGMWNASTAFLPSSFAMYTTTLAFSYTIAPANSQNKHRTLSATLLFATGGIVGWPFALALAIPFVFEELFVHGADRVASQNHWSWMSGRWKRLILCGAAALLLFIPVIGIDSLGYGRISVVPWNIVRYNIFGGSERGPELYGTSPWSFYLLNLTLNFNVLLPLALLVLPALAVTYRVDRKRLEYVKPSPDQSSPFTLLALRLAPFYLWFGILTFQPHKEGRFMFPAYPLLCFNAAVALYLIRGWQEVIFIYFTKSPYQASKSSIFRNFTSSVLVAATIISVSRILAMWKYYHAPLSVVYAFQTDELPRLLNVSGLLPSAPPNTPVDELPRIDLSPIKEFDLRLCVGKEWYRFPGHYLVPDHVRVDFIKSEFNGLVPGHFAEGEMTDAGHGVASTWWPRVETTYIPKALNDLNREEPSHYVPVESCDYLIDLDFPLHPVSSALEPRYVTDDKTWERVFCMPFLDARHSALLTRTLWFPGESWQIPNKFGDYCLLKNRELVGKKEWEVAQREKKAGL